MHVPVACVADCEPTFCFMYCGLICHIASWQLTLIFVAIDLACMDFCVACAGSNPCPQKSQCRLGLEGHGALVAGPRMTPGANLHHLQNTGGRKIGPMNALNGTLGKSQLQKIQRPMANGMMANGMTRGGMMILMVSKRTKELKRNQRPTKRVRKKAQQKCRSSIHYVQQCANLCLFWQ